MFDTLKSLRDKHMSEQARADANKELKSNFSPLINITQVLKKIDGLTEQ